MKFNFHNKKISGILTVIPKKVLDFDDEISNYNASPKQMKRLKEIFGFGKHRIVDAGTCMSDLAVFGVEKIFEKNLLKREEVGALLLVTESPDYFLPPTSNVIQGRLGLSQDVYCLDINNGCCGYIVGLLQAFQLLEHMTDKKVLLIVGDILSLKVSKRDRKSFPLSGDAAAITIVENDPKSDEKIFADILMDGTRADSLMIPAGGFKTPCSAETAIEYEDADGNIRCLNNITMKGGEVFNFMQVDVPPLIENVLQNSGKNKSDIDYFLFHQPNKFMLEKLAGELNISQDKMPNNIVSHFGNAAGATIPTNICFNLTPDILNRSYNVCMSGFGVGLTWGAIAMQLGSLSFCEFAEY